MTKKISTYQALPTFIALAMGLTSITLSGAALAHDPIFGIGPHVLFKDGIELAIATEQDKAGADSESEYSIELVYGITGDWAAGLELPYTLKGNETASSSGVGDLNLFTKYRFWREDSFGLQRSVAVMLAINAKNGDETAKPALGNGAVDIMTGITYGYESLEKYYWASLRQLKPGGNNAGLQLGEKSLIDFVVGWRPTLPEYKKPDTVWLLELNGEITEQARLHGTTLSNSGGTEWFLSPGIFWTTRNVAIKAGIQLPLSHDLNGNQDPSDYRFKASLEFHL